MAPRTLFRSPIPQAFISLPIQPAIEFSLVVAGFLTVPHATLSPQLTFPPAQEFMSFALLNRAGQVKMYGRWRPLDGSCKNRNHHETHTCPGPHCGRVAVRFGN